MYGIWALFRILVPFCGKDGALGQLNCVSCCSLVWILVLSCRLLESPSMWVLRVSNSVQDLL
jgi:hypothetical protein